MIKKLTTCFAVSTQSANVANGQRELPQQLSKHRDCSVTTYRRITTTWWMASGTASDANSFPSFIISAQRSNTPFSLKLETASSSTCVFCYFFTRVAYTVLGISYWTTNLIKNSILNVHIIVSRFRSSTLSIRRPNGASNTRQSKQARTFFVITVKRIGVKNGIKTHTHKNKNQLI